MLSWNVFVDNMSEWTWFHLGIKNPRIKRNLASKLGTARNRINEMCKLLSTMTGKPKDFKKNSAKLQEMLEEYHDLSEKFRYNEHDMFGGVRSKYFDENGDLGFDFKERTGKRGTTSRPLPEHYVESRAKRPYVAVSTEEYLKTWKEENSTDKENTILGKRKSVRSTSPSTVVTASKKHDGGKKTKYTSKETCPSASSSDDEEPKKKSVMIKISGRRMFQRLRN